MDQLPNRRQDQALHDVFTHDNGRGNASTFCNRDAISLGLHLPVQQLRQLERLRLVRSEAEKHLSVLRQAGERSVRQPGIRMLAPQVRLFLGLRQELL